jgi:hypothetical protein
MNDKSVKFTELVDGLNRCTNAEYHADRKYLSSSVLKTVYKSLEKYHLEYIVGAKNPTSIETQKIFDEGTLAHAYILEPHTVETDFNFYDGAFKKGPQWNEFLAKLDKDDKKPIFSLAQNMRVLKWISAYRALQTAVNLIQGGEPELVICGKLHGVPIKVRFDYINVEQGYIADVKTTGHSSDVESFKQTVDSFMYHLSAALYCEMAEQYYGKPFKFYYIVLSKKDHDCNVFVTSDETMIRGKQIVLEACQKYRKAIETNTWTDSNHNAIVLSSGDYEIEEV